MNLNSPSTKKPKDFENIPHIATVLDSKFTNESAAISELIDNSIQVIIFYNKINYLQIIYTNQQATSKNELSIERIIKIYLFDDELLILDNGIGMTEEILGKVFLKFNYVGQIIFFIFKINIVIICIYISILFT